MAQYRSQWTGEVIDDAVGKAKNIEYVIAGVDAQAAFEKVDAAYGIAPVYAVYTTFENFSEISCRCVERETPGGQIVYRFEGIDSQQKQWRWTLAKSEYSVADEGGYHSETRYAWNGPFTTQMEGREATSKTVALYENSQTATQNIAKGQYVIWSSRLYTADSDIAAGTVLRSAGANKNLTAVSNGGLNDLKSALNAITPTYTVPSAGANITYQSGQLIAMKIGNLVSVGGILTVTGAVAAGDVLLSNMPVSSLGGAVANDQPVLVTAVNLSTYVETVITCKIGYNGTLKATDSISSNTALRMGFTYSLYEV